MADLSYTVQVNGVQDLDKLSNTIDKLHGVLDASKGSGKSLEEIRRIIVGMKGSASVFTDLRDAVRELNTSANSLKTGFQSSLKELTVVIKQTMQESVATMRTAGREQSMALASGIESGTGEVTSAIRRQGKTISAVARQEATKMYEAMVGNNPSAKMTERGMGALLQFKEAGAQLSAYHKEALASWVNNGRLTMAARIKSENDTQNALKAIQAANNKASQIDISGFQAMNRLRLTAAKQAHDDDLAGFKQMNNLRIADHNRTLQALKKANDKAIQDDLAGYRQMLNLKVAAETKAEAEIAQRRGMLGVTPSIRATATMPRSSEIDGASRAFKGLGDNMNYAHSMSRGLASGFNLLWLTWGDLAPLFIGAAISNGFMQTAKQGMEVAHTLTVIGTVGGNTTEQMGLLTDEMLRLSNVGPFGPKEIADAMKTLSLAGLQANEILKVTGDVLNFSVAGTTTIEKAAETLIQVTTAFNLGSQGFSYASDVISKAAADSMTSVEAFSGAMRAASVIGEQYGVSLKDTAVAIGALSNLGIQASAAGTAVRNMYSDLSGSTIKVTKLMQKLGLDVRDSAGNFLPLVDMIGKVSDKLREYDSKSAKNLMGAIFSERGAKPFVEGFRQIQTAVEETGESFSNMLAKSRASLDNAAGFSAINAAKLSQSAEKQFEAVGATLKASMFKAYQELEPELVLIFQRMKEAFSSPEFIGGLTGIINALGTLAKVLADHASTLATVALAYAALKTVQAASLGGYALMTAASAALARLTATETAMTAAQTAALAGNTTAQLLNNTAKAAGAGAASSALGALGLLGRAIPVVNAALGIGTAAWMAYEYWNSKSKDTASEAADNYHGSVVKALNDEAVKLKRINDLRITGITLKQAEKQIESEDAASRSLKSTNTELDKARKSYTDALEAQNKFFAENKNAKANANSGEGAAGVMGRLDRQGLILQRNSEKALAGLQGAYSKSEKAQTEFYTSEQNLMSESQKKAKWLEDDMAAALERRKDLWGDKTFSQGDLSGGGKDGAQFQKFFIAKDNEMKMIQQQATDELSMLKKLAGDKQKVLESERATDIISEAEYQAKLVMLQQQSSEAQLASIRGRADEYLLAAKKQRDYLNKELAGAKSEPHREALKGRLDDLGREVETITGAALRSIEEVQSASLTAIQVAANRTMITLKKLKDSTEDFLRKDEGERRKTKTLAALAEQYRFINDSVFSFDLANRAGAEAGALSMEKYAVEIDKVAASLKDANEELANYKPQGLPGEEAYLNSLKKRVKDTKDLLGELNSESAEAAADAYNTAWEATRKDQVAKFSSSLGDAVMTGLLEGGKQGRKKLRDIIVSELQKPITLVVNAIVNQIAGPAINSFMQMMGMTSGQGGAAGSMGGIMGSAQNLSTLNSLYSAFTGYSSNVATLASMVGMGSTAGAGIGTLAYGNAVGAIGGDALGAFIAGNGAWGGVSVGAGAGSAVGAAGAGSTAGAGGAGAGAGLTGTAGAAAGTLAGVAVGVYGGRAISNGYSLNGGSGNTAVNVGTALGTAVGAFFGMPGVGSAIGGALGGAVNAMFGRKLKETGIEGTFGGESGFEGNRFKFEKGGWFKSDKTTRSPLEEGVRQELAGQFNTLKLGATTLAKDLGLGTSAIDGFTSSFKVNLKGLSDEEAGTKVAEEFDKIANAMADSILGTKQYSRTNESSLQTLTRLSGTLKYVNIVMGNLGGALYEVSLAGANSAQNLIDMFGGLDAFNSSLNSYYENFYTENERTKNTTRELTAALKDLGFSMPTSREGFRAIVDSVLKLGDKGNETLVSLMGMQQAFADLFPAIDNMTDAAELAAEAFDKQVESVKGLVTEVEKLSAARKRSGSLVDKIDAAMGKPTGNYAYEREQELWAMSGKGSLEQQLEIAEELTDLVLARMDRERESADLQLASAEESKKFWESTLEFVASLTTGNLSPLTTEQKLAAAQDRYYQTYSKAVAGDSEAQGNLQGSASEYLELARMFYASSQAYSDIFNSVTGGLTQAANNGINSPAGSATGLPGSFQQESYDQLMQLRTISANAYDQLSAQLVTAQNLLSVEYSMLEMQAAQLGKSDEVKGLLSNLPAEIALALPAFNASVFEQMGYNQARAVESLEAVRAELVLVRETGSQEAHMQAAIYVEAFEKMLIAMQEIVSHSTQANALSNQTLV